MGVLLDPQSEDIRTHPLNAEVFDPFPTLLHVGIPGRDQSFLHCGEFIVLRDCLEIDAEVDGQSVTLHAKVGRILRITLRAGDIPRILLSLLCLASNFPKEIIREGAAPPDRRQYVEYPTHVVVSNIVKRFSGAAILSEAMSRIHI